MSIINEGHYFLRTGGIPTDGLNVTLTDLCIRFL
ncbi:copper resistance protein [Escherichia coli]|nr:copper resistance protein [Escherichia coli]